MKQKKAGTGSFTAGGLALGVGVSILTMLLLTGICAAMISSEIVASSAEGYCTVGALLISTLAGSEFASMKIQGKRLAVCVLEGIIYLIVLFATTALFFGGQYQGVGVTAIVVLSGSVIAAFTGLQGKKRRVSHKSKIRHR